MAARTELGGLLAVERLEEDLAVRLRIDVGQLVVHESEQRVVARREVVERRVLDLEVPLAHRAADLGDRVARGAAEPGLRFRRVDLLLDRPIEPAVEEHRVIVAAGAPLRRRGADDVLHVLDRLAIPLVVERGEVVRRGLPLLVDVGVAPPAALAGHEEVGRDDAADVGVGRRGEERAVRAAAFLLHARRHHSWGSRSGTAPSSATRASSPCRRRRRTRPGRARKRRPAQDAPAIAALAEPSRRPGRGAVRRRAGSGRCVPGGAIACARPRR